MSKNKSLTSSLAFWLNYATFLLSTLNAPGRARALLQRAMQSVPAQQHRELTTKFAALEFQSPNGDPERGRTIFEGLIAAFPKRGDVWDIWVDLEKTKGGEAKEQVRDVYRRMSGVRMKRRRAMWVFKRWEEYEGQIGDRKGVERVRALREGWERGQAEGDEKEGE